MRRIEFVLVAATLLAAGIVSGFLLHGCDSNDPVQRVLDENALGEYRSRP